MNEQQTPETQKKEKRSLLKKLKSVTEQKWFVQTLPILFLALLVVFFSVTTKGRFLDPMTLLTIFRQALIVATVATGASFIYASGNVNIAMGATTVLTATVAAMVYNATESFAAMLAVALLVSVLIMIISVLLSTIFNVRVMFVTIVMMTLLKALQDSLLGGGYLGVPYSLVTFLSDTNYSLIAFLVFFVVAMILFHFTAIGRSLKMIGTNNENAYQTGIVKSKYLLIAFVIAGIGAGLASVMVIERAGSLSPQTLTSLNTDVMLAIVLGGMSIFGGSKSYAYTGIIGSLTVCVLNQGLLMLRVPSQYIQAVRGIIFLVLIMTAQQRPKGLPAPEG